MVIDWQQIGSGLFGLVRSKNNKGFSFKGDLMITLVHNLQFRAHCIQHHLSKSGIKFMRSGNSFNYNPTNYILSISPIFIYRLRTVLDLQLTLLGEKSVKKIKRKRKRKASAYIIRGKGAYSTEFLGGLDSDLEILEGLLMELRISP